MFTVIYDYMNSLQELNQFCAGQAGKSVDKIGAECNRNDLELA